MAKSSKIGLVGLYYQIKRTFCRKQINISHFVLYNTFLECCNPRFLNKTEIKIIKIQSARHNAYTSNSKNWRYVYDQTICLWSMIKLSELSDHSMLAGGIKTKRKSKCNTFTLLHLENVYTSYSFMYFILGRQYLFIAWGVRLSIFFTLFFTLSTLLFVGYFQSFAIGITVYFSFFLIHTFFNNGGPSWVGIKIVIQL